jgi:hypothetical protein
LEYEGQYVTLAARPGGGKLDGAIEHIGEVFLLEQSVSHFAERLPAWLTFWSERLRHYKEQNSRVVVWGSGSKGVAFLTSVDVEGLVEYVVDINPNRQGHYMVKTGQEIVGPRFLASYDPDVVIAMNPIYRAEIDDEMRRHGVDAELVTT